MNKEFNKIDWIIPLASSGIYFAAIVLHFPSWVYIIFALIAALYYLPFRFFTNKQIQNKSIYFASCFLCSALLILSIVHLINPSPFYKNAVYWLLLANFAFLIISLMMKNQQKISAIHLCFMLFAAGVAFVGQ